MDDSISGTARSAPAPSPVARTGAAGAWVHLLGQVVQGAPVQRGATEPPAPSPASTVPVQVPVRSGDFGRGGRFEKFILALQALRLDAGAATNRTDRVERMRAAAEELFGIDGMPQPVRPLAEPAASIAADVDAKQVEHPEKAEPDRPPLVLLSEPARPIDAGTVSTADPIDSAPAIPPAASPAAVGPATPAPGDVAAGD